MEVAPFREKGGEAETRPISKYLDEENCCQPKSAPAQVHSNRILMKFYLIDSIIISLSLGQVKYDCYNYDITSCIECSVHTYCG